jgi:hypothetical protein
MTLAEARAIFPVSWFVADIDDPGTPIEYFTGKLHHTADPSSEFSGTAFMLSDLTPRQARALAVLLSFAVDVDAAP